MKRKIIGLLLISLVCTFLFACVSKNQSVQYRKKQKSKRKKYNKAAELPVNSTYNYSWYCATKELKA